MIFIIGLAVIGFIIGCFGYEPFLESLFGAFLGAAIGFCIALFTGMVLYTGTEWQHKNRPLVSLADSINMEGHFFLGSGSVDSEPAFTWYEQNGNNSYVRKFVYADSATIHYLNDGRAPYYKHSYKVYSTRGFTQTWGLNTAIGREGTEYWDFYVPKGAIVQSYKLDNK